MFEEGSENCLFRVKTIGGVHDIVKKFFVVPCDTVRQVNIFHPLPALLHRVQLRWIGGKVFEAKPIGMCLDKPIRRRTMSGKTIHNDDYSFIVILMKLCQKEDHVFGVNCTGDYWKAKGEPTQFRTGRQKADPRLIGAAVVLAQNRRISDGRPCLAGNYSKWKAWFIEKNYRKTTLFRFFFIRGQVRLIHRSTSSVDWRLSLTIGFW